MNTWRIGVSGTLLVALCACSGGGGGFTAPQAVNYTMTDVKPPANAGTVGGFVYATQQSVTLDVALPDPYKQYVVSIYSKNPAQSLYGSSGVVTQAAAQLLSQGISSTTADGSGLYHYTEKIMVPTAATSVYVGPIMGLEPKGVVVPITGGAATYSGFTKIPGGV